MKKLIVALALPMVLIGCGPKEEVSDVSPTASLPAKPAAPKVGKDPMSRTPVSGDQANGGIAATP